MIKLIVPIVDVEGLMNVIILAGYNASKSVTGEGWFAIHVRGSVPQHPGRVKVMISLWMNAVKRTKARQGKKFLNQ